MGWFRKKPRPVEVRYIPSEPRYQSLGYMEGCIYFINSHSGKVFRINRDFISNQETVTHVFTTGDR